MVFRMEEPFTWVRLLREATLATVAVAEAGVIVILWRRINELVAQLISTLNKQTEILDAIRRVDRGE
jgi:hypothetical protein